MSKRSFPAFITLTLLFCMQVAQAQPQRPNVLLVLSDDHSAAHVGAYGNPDIKTPNLDKFAAQGMRFERAYVAAPQCVPSRAALMTGRSPVALQMTRFSAPLPIEHKTWLELLRGAGWFTGVAGRTYHLDGSALPPESQVVFDKHQLKTFERRLDFVRVGGGGKPIHIGAVAQFREFLDQAKGKPFALQLCFSDPHRPLDANAIPEPHDPKKIKLPAHYPDTPGVREDFARNYDEIARFDGSFAEVLEELNKRGLAENTIVVFMGDNGASQFRGKGTLYEYGVRVPLIVRWPGKVKAGSVTKDGKLSPLLQRLYFSPTRPMFELFDLESDPSEFNNLIGSGEHAAVERELKAALQEWMILERDYLPLPVPPAPAR